MIGSHEYKSKLYNKNTKAVILLDDEDKLTIFKLEPEDNTNVEAFFEDVIDYRQNSIVVAHGVDLKEVNINISYNRNPKTVYVEGTLGGLINGLYSE